MPPSLLSDTERLLCRCSLISTACWAACIKLKRAACRMVIAQVFSGQRKWSQAFLQRWLFFLASFWPSRIISSIQKLYCRARIASNTFTCMTSRVGGENLCPSEAFSKLVVLWLWWVCTAAPLVSAQSLSSWDLCLHESLRQQFVAALYERHKKCALACWECMGPSPPVWSDFVVQPRRCEWIDQCSVGTRSVQDIQHVRVRSCHATRAAHDWAQCCCILRGIRRITLPCNASILAEAVMISSPLRLPQWRSSCAVLTRVCVLRVVVAFFPITKPRPQTQQ